VNFTAPTPNPAPPGTPWVIDAAIYCHAAYQRERADSKRDGILAMDDPPPSTVGPRLVSMLSDLVERHRITRAIAVWDGPGNFRKALDPRYKAHRPPKPPGLRQLLEEGVKWFGEAGISSTHYEGLEADDVMASAAYCHNGAVLCTTDKDLLQVLGVNGCRIWDPFRMPASPEPKGTLLAQTQAAGPAGCWIDEEVMFARLGTRNPAHVVHIQALMGDTSDGVIGCPGIGAVGAAHLIARYGHVDTIYVRMADQDAGRAHQGLDPEDEAKYGQKLRAGAWSVATALKLVTLKRDLAVPIYQVARPERANMFSTTSPQEGQPVNPLLAKLLAKKNTETPAPAETLAPAETPATRDPAFVLGRVEVMVRQAIKDKQDPRDAAKRCNEAYKPELRLEPAQVEAVVQRVLAEAKPAPANMLDALNSATNTVTVNPPDGVPADAPATEYAPGGAEDPDRKADKPEEVVPEGHGEYSGKRWAELRKDEYVAFYSQLAGEAPSKGLGRTDLKTMCQSMVREQPKDDDTPVDYAASCGEPSMAERVEAASTNVEGLKGLAEREAVRYTDEEPPANNRGPEVLYINCHPRRSRVTYLDDVIATYQREVERDAGLPHYSLVQFNRGPALVAASLHDALTNGKLDLSGLHLVVTREHPCAAACLDVLCQWAGMVVEGTR